MEKCQSGEPVYKQAFQAIFATVKWANHISELSHHALKCRAAHSKFSLVQEFCVQGPEASASPKALACWAQPEWGKAMAEQRLAVQARLPSSNLCSENHVSRLKTSDLQKYHGKSAGSAQATGSGLAWAWNSWDSPAWHYRYWRQPQGYRGGWAQWLLLPGPGSRLRQPLPSQSGKGGPLLIYQNILQYLQSMLARDEKSTVKWPCILILVSATGQEQQVSLPSMSPGRALLQELLLMLKVWRQYWCQI